jgi:hypothetical protein
LINASGHERAAKYGAVGTIVRSMNMRLDDFPYRCNGLWRFTKSDYIPTAISTNGAELLSKTLKANPNLKFYFKQSCQQLEDVLSYNVVGDYRNRAS